MDDARQISAFVAAADELHLGRAADRLGVHPATVASRLRALEASVELVLVDRSHRCRIALTQAGTALLPVARRALEAMDAFEQQSAEVRQGTRGMVRVALTSDGDARTAALVDELRRVDAGWDVSVERMSVEAAGRALAVGAVECCLGVGTSAPRTAADPFDRRPNRLERARVARIRPAPDEDDAGGTRAGSAGLDDAGETRAGSAGLEDAGGAFAGSAGLDGVGGAPAEAVGDRLVIAWRATWELEEPASAPLAATLVARVRQLRVLAGGRRAAAVAARRRAVADRRRAVEAERRLIEEDIARYGFAEAAARAAARDRAEVLRRVADARARGEPLGLHLTIQWLCLPAEDRRADDPDGRGDGPLPS